MAQGATPSGIYEWIVKSCHVQPTDTATLRYGKMESQADYSLPEIHQQLDHKDARHWHQRGMICDYVHSLEGAKRVLDVGPGDGWPGLLIARHFEEVVGIEPIQKRLDVCETNAKMMRVRNVRFERMSACDMSFRAGSFDGVVAATSIEQTPDPNAALAEVFRVLKVGGTFRLSYEAFENLAEPIREVVSIQRGRGNSFKIDYVVSWTEKAEERGYLIEVEPQSENSKKRFLMWAERCKDDTFPHRDPRLERGLTQTIQGIRKTEVQSCSGYKLKHFKTSSLIKTLTQIGFADIRRISGGGWPAMQCAEELIYSHRIQAAAPIMEEICRGAAKVGTTLPTETHGELIMMKRKAAARAAGKVRGKPSAKAGAKPAKKTMTKKAAVKKKSKAAAGGKTTSKKTTKKTTKKTDSGAPKKAPAKKPTSKPAVKSGARRVVKKKSSK